MNIGMSKRLRLTEVILTLLQPPLLLWFSKLHNIINTNHNNNSIYRTEAPKLLGKGDSRISVIQAQVPCTNMVVEVVRRIKGRYSHLFLVEIQHPLEPIPSQTWAVVPQWESGRIEEYLFKTRAMDFFFFFSLQPTFWFPSALANLLSTW